MPQLINGGDSVHGSSESSGFSTDSERSSQVDLPEFLPNFFAEELSDFLQGGQVSEAFTTALNKKMLELVKLIREEKTDNISNHLTTVEPLFFRGKSNEIEFNSFFANQYLEQFLSGLKDESGNDVITQGKTRDFLDNLCVLSKKILIDQVDVDSQILQNLSECISKEEKPSTKPASQPHFMGRSLSADSSCSKSSCN